MTLKGITIIYGTKRQFCQALEGCTKTLVGAIPSELIPTSPCSPFHPFTGSYHNTSYNHNAFIIINYKRASIPLSRSCLLLDAPHESLELVIFEYISIPMPALYLGPLRILINHQCIISLWAFVFFSVIGSLFSFPFLLTTPTFFASALRTFMH